MNLRVASRGVAGVMGVGWDAAWLSTNGRAAPAPGAGLHLAGLPRQWGGIPPNSGRGLEKS